MKRNIFIGSIILNAILLIFSVSLLFSESRLKKYVKKISQSSASSSPISRHFKNRNDLFNAMKSPANKVVLLGDSLIEQGNWNELFNSTDIVNRGVAGLPIEQLTTSEYLDKIEGNNSVGILIGINNFWLGEDLKSIVKKLDILFEKLQSKKFKKVFFISLLPSSRSELAERMGDVVKFNMLLRTKCIKSGHGFIDVFSEFLSPDSAVVSLDEKYSFDGIHLNGKGYLKLKSILLEKSSLFDQVTKRTQNDL